MSSLYWNFFALKINSEIKKPILSFPWAEPEGPTPTPLRPSWGPLEPIRAQALAAHGQHDLSVVAAFLGVRATPRRPVRPYKAAAKASARPLLPSCRLHRASLPLYAAEPVANTTAFPGRRWRIGWRLERGGVNRSR
jgi:hypothetical protein